MNQSPSVFDVINNPRFSTKKELRQSCSKPRRQPPKLRKKTSRRLFPTQPIALMNSENHNFSRIYNESVNVSYFDQCFEQAEKIGEGSFGEVYKVRSKDNGQYYAVKVSKFGFRGDFDREERIAEVRNYERLPQHENIVPLLYAWEQDDCVYLQMELGYLSLEQYTEDNPVLTEQQLWNVLLDMLLALKNLHDNNLIHLDVKLENIIISHSGSCKLCDFGLLVNLKDAQRLKNATEGDAKYLAVELMEGKFTKAADVFSLGITMLELAGDLALPVNGPLWHSLRNCVFPDYITNNIPKEFLNIIRRMMRKDFKKRPSIKTLLRHPRLKSLLKQRKDAKNQGREFLGKLTPLATIRTSTPIPVFGMPATPPNNGLRTSNSMVLLASPTEEFNRENIPLFSNMNASFTSLCDRQFDSEMLDVPENSITATPYITPMPMQPKYSKNVIISSAKKLNFVNDM